MSITDTQRTLNVPVQLLRGTEEQWTAVATTYIPLAGEPCVTLDGDYAGQIKIGNGTDNWGTLPYVGIGEIGPDENTLTVNDKIMSIKGFAEAQAGYVPSKSASGTLVWGQPAHTYTVTILE